MNREHDVEDAEETISYQVILAPAAQTELQSITSKRDLAKVKKSLLLLDTVPEIGRQYDPDYPASRPFFNMRVFFAGRYAIYYVVEEGSHEVYVLFIEDQRRDPLNRFYGIFPHESE